MKSPISFLISILLFITSCKVTETIKSSQKEITSIQLKGISGTTSSFDPNTNTYTFTVPNGTDIKQIVLTFSLPMGATSSPSSGMVLDFSNPINCIVTAEDGSKQIYKIIIVVQNAPKSNLKQILSFSFEDLNPVVKATINQSTFEIIAQVPVNTNLKSLKPTIIVDNKATIVPNSLAIQDFTNPVKYIVTAEDNSTSTYIVNVKVLSESNLCNAKLVNYTYNDKSITGFGFSYDKNQNLIAYAFIEPFTNRKTSVSLSYKSDMLTSKIFNYEKPDNDFEYLVREEYMYEYNASGLLNNYSQRLVYQDPKKISVRNVDTYYYLTYAQNNQILTYRVLSQNNERVQFYTNDVLTKIEDGVNVFELDKNGFVKKQTLKNNLNNYQIFTYDNNGLLIQTDYYSNNKIYFIIERSYYDKKTSYLNFYEQNNYKGHPDINSTHIFGKRNYLLNKLKGFDVDDKGQKKLTSESSYEYTFMPNNQNIAIIKYTTIDYESSPIKQDKFNVYLQFENCK